MLLHVEILARRELREQGREVLRRFEDAALLAFLDAIQGMGKKHVVVLDLRQEVEREVQVLSLPCVAQAAHGFVSEGAGRGAGRREQHE